ncbi:MAG: hypothetical protein KGR26_11100, partial [Cyanobacteria bacterium REEB65]|nr:hypothetical protein [Cyanobacteria bacterium REEB65]
VIQDVDGLAYSVSIHNGDVELWEGLRAGVIPSLVVPLTRAEALELPGLLDARGMDARGRAIRGLSEDGLFRMVQLFLVPGLEAFYSRSDLYPKNGSKGRFKLDDLVQFEIAPPQGDSDLPERVTVANVDGQWLFLQGWHGEPDIRLKLTPLEALNLYQETLRTPPTASRDIDKEAAVRNALKLWNKAIVFTRSDH